jgi:transposase-like protein
MDAGTTQPAASTTPTCGHCGIAVLTSARRSERTNRYICASCYKKRRARRLKGTRRERKRVKSVLFFAVVVALGLMSAFLAQRCAQSQAQHQPEP